MAKRIGIGGLVVAVALGCAPAIAQTMDIKTVALKKDDSPEAGHWYVRFNRPAVGDATVEPVAFWSRVRGITGSKKGIFKDGPDGASGSTVVLSGDSGPESRLFKKFSNPTMNASGDVAFSATLTGGIKGVFRGDPTVVTLLGDSVPGVTGLLNGFSYASLTDAGDVVFRGAISGGAEVDGVKVKEGIFRCTGGDGNCSSGTGSLEALVLINDSASDRKICDINEVAASNFGIVFVAETKEDCDDGNEITRTGVFRKPFGGSIVTVALEGELCEPFPTEPGGTTYGLIWTIPDVANDGTVVFKARTTGATTSIVLYHCAPLTCPGSPAEAAVMQGTVDQDGNVFKRFSPPAVSDAGDMAFKATGRGASGRSTGVYVWRLGTPEGDPPETVALQGDLVPDLEPNTEFARLLAKTSRPDMSPSGRIAFKAKVRKALPPRYRLEGIFLADVIP